MARILAGVAALILFVAGIAMVWRGSDGRPALPPAPAAASQPSLLAQPMPVPPEASAKSREEKRFSRADKDKDGRIAREELLGPRRKAFAKLDKNGNGSLEFEEWAVRTVDKFTDADKDRTGWLTPAEFAVTAPPPPKKKRCAC
jgi:hypothetical protein